MTEEIRTGDVVRLNSCPQTMSVRALRIAVGEQMAEVVWIDVNGRPWENVYPLFLLEKVQGGPATR